jgi:hypothetical protein
MKSNRPVQQCHFELVNRLICRVRGTVIDTGRLVEEKDLG